MIVNKNESLFVRLPSLTVTVIVVVPLKLVAGVIVTVRFAPDPPKAMLALGTSVVLEELPDSVRLLTLVSTSPTVKAIAEVGTFSLVDWFAMSAMVGASFTLVTLILKTFSNVNTP